MEQDQLDQLDRMLLEQAVRQVEKAVVGKRATIELVMKAMLCGGHVLLEDVPGVGKTLLVRAVARAMDGDFKRIQFTPDVMPSDITGLHIWDRNQAEFSFRPGPLFAHMVLADEINRASAKTQSALLEAMEEKEVSESGRTFALPDPFVVLATQNPADHEGTYVLPEAQMDRFLFRLSIGYPTLDDEAEMLARGWGQTGAGDALARVRPAMAREEWARLRDKVGKLYTDSVLFRYAAQLAAAARRHPEVRLGPSPRAAKALLRAAQAEAFWQGRDYVLPDDLQAMLGLVWGHRISLHGGYNEPDQVLAILDDLCRKVPVPGRPDEPRKIGTIRRVD